MPLVIRRRRRPPAPAGDRDPVVGLRRLRHALRHVPAARPAARRVRAARRRRRGPPADRDRARGRAALPVGRGRRLRRAARAHRGARAARRRRQPEPVPGPRLQARLGHAPRRRPCASAPSRTCSSASRSPRRWARPRSRCGSPTARTTPARTTCARAGAGCSTRSAACTPRCPPTRSCWSSTSSSSRRSTRPTSPTGARRCCVCQQLGERARVLVDLGHHAQGANVEQIVALLADEGRLGGFHFNNRKYADDDLIVGSVNPFELFLIFCELVAAAAPLPRLTIDQSHNVEAKVEAMVLSVVNLQEAYAKALLVDRDALGAAQAAGDVLGGHEALLDAYRTDVRPLCAARARGARRRGGPDRRAARAPATPRASPPNARPTRRSPDEHRHPADRPRRRSLAGRRRRPPGDAARRSSCSPPTCSARTAPCRTSAAATRRRRAPRPTTRAARSPVMWVKGSGSDLATMGARALHRRCGSTRCCR